MLPDDDKPPTLAQRQMWLFQTVTVAVALSVAVISLCVATMTLGWRPGLMPVVAVMASVAWTGAIALAQTLATARLVSELRDELIADQRQLRTDEIRAELDLDDNVSVRRLRR